MWVFVTIVVVLLLLWLLIEIGSRVSVSSSRPKIPSHVQGLYTHMDDEVYTLVYRRKSRDSRIGFQKILETDATVDFRLFLSGDFDSNEIRAKIRANLDEIEVTESAETCSIKPMKCPDSVVALTFHIDKKDGHDMVMDRIARACNAVLDACAISQDEPLRAFGDVRYDFQKLKNEADGWLENAGPDATPGLYHRWVSWMARKAEELKQDEQRNKQSK